MLLAALLVERQWEITDTLVELLISTVHAINARADRRVTEEMVASGRWTPSPMTSQPGHRSIHRTQHSGCPNARAP